MATWLESYRTAIIIALAALVGALLLACGGSDNVSTPTDTVPVVSTPTLMMWQVPVDTPTQGAPPDIIRLPDRDYTEEEVRQFMQGLIDSFGLDDVCSGYLDTENDAALLEYVKEWALQSGESEDYIRQPADVEDAEWLRFGQIALAECSAGS